MVDKIIRTPLSGKRSHRVIDPSQEKIYFISKGTTNAKQLAGRRERLIVVRTVSDTEQKEHIPEQETDETINESNQPFVVDQEVLNLIGWLAEEQGLTPEMALKKAVITAAYIYDITANEKGELLIKQQDKTIRKIDLKQ